MFVMFVKTLFVLLRTLTGHLHVVVMAVVGVVLQLLRVEHQGVPQLLLTAGRALTEAEQVLADVATARRLGGHHHHLWSRGGGGGVSDLQGNLGVRIDKLGVDGEGNNLDDGGGS